MRFTIVQYHPVSEKPYRKLNSCLEEVIVDVHECNSSLLAILPNPR